LERRWTTIGNRLGADRRRSREHDVPVRDEVDDTDMTAAEFRAAEDRGTPTQVVRSREEFDAQPDLDALADDVGAAAAGHGALGPGGTLVEDRSRAGGAGALEAGALGRGQG
jgi:hypothetical protein